MGDGTPPIILWVPEKHGWDTGGGRQTMLEARLLSPQRLSRKNVYGNEGLQVQTRAFRLHPLKKPDDTHDLGQC